MRWLQPRTLIIAFFMVMGLFLGAGVFAASNLVLNSGNNVELGAGAQKVNPCDDDLNLTPIVYNDGYNSYIQGFQYDNVNKAACVGYDIETRFVSNSEASMNLFATSSIVSEPNLVRVFAPTSSSTWRLGLGAYSTEVTVTQISASSFKVIFTTPIALVSDFGRFVMAEITHLPLGTFTAGFSEIGTTLGLWNGSCITSNSTKFYVLDQSTGLYQSSNIPVFPGSVAGVQTSKVVSSAIPSSGVTWYGLGCSRSGQYLAITGTSNQLSYSSDFGATWESRTVSSLTPGYINNSGGRSNLLSQISISDDGKVVALATGGSYAGVFNFWVNGNFWNSNSTAADGTFEVAGGTSSVSVSGDGLTIYGGGGSSTAAFGLYRWNTSSITSGGSKASVNPAYSSNSFGKYIRSIDCSYDGQSAVIASNSTDLVYVTRDRFTTSYSPTGFASTNQGFATKPYTVSMSANGRFIAIGTGHAGVSNYGTTQFSTDYGNNVTDTSFVNRYMQTIVISDDGSRMITGGGGYAPASKIVILGSN